jgi:putative SOS response-associated peptidase YedK
VQPFFFAGLWSTWRDRSQPDAEPLETFTILTREAAPGLRGIHDRMPVVLPPDAYAAWLDPALTEGVRATEVLAAAMLEGFHAHPVGTRVNSPRNDDPDCMRPASAV